MSELHALDPGLATALRAWRQDSLAPVRPAAMASARGAMHQARVARLQRRRVAVLGSRFRAALTPGRLLAGAGGVAAGLAAVAVLGWNAPAGSPFHVVRLAHEDIAMAVPGADRTGLDLAFAEARLREVRQGAAPAAALDEAARLLDDAHARLPADHASPLWERWQDDVHELDGLRGPHPGEDGAPSAPAVAPGGAPPAPDAGHRPGPPGGAPGGGHRTESTTTETHTESHSFSTFTSTHSEGRGSSTTSESHSTGRSESTTTTSPHD
jgi:hypothetical protein